MRNWLSELPYQINVAVALCLILLTLSLSGGKRLIAWAVFLAFLITSYFQDPPT
jgi:hypothetical protein